MKPVEQPRRSPRAERLTVGMCCALFALSLGVHYGVADQNVYLLSGLRLADPSFLARDWFAAETVQHHAAFTHLVYLLHEIGPLPWTSAVLYLILKALVAFSAYLVLRALYDRPLLPFLFSLTALYLAVGTTKLLSHPFFVPWLLPSGTAGALFLAGVAALAAAAPGQPWRCALSGALFGLSGLFHGTFLFLIPVFLGGVWIARPRGLSRREIAAFAVPFLAVTLPAIGSVLTRFDLGEGDFRRLDALLRARAPHHHLPRSWGLAGFSLFAGHAALGLVGLLVRRPDAPRSWTALIPAAVLSGLFALVFFGTVVVFVPRVAALQAFHFVGLLSFFCLLFFAGALAQEADAGRQPLSARRLRRLALLAAGLFVACWTNRAAGVALTALFGLCLAGGMFARNPPAFVRRTALWGTALFLAGLSAFCLPLSTAFFTPHGPDYRLCRWVRSLTPPKALAVLMPSEPEADLYRWVRAATPGDALFVTPLDMERFRLGAGRGVVVDWKAFPYRLKDAEEWYRRVGAVSGVSSPASKQEALRGYLSLDAGHARDLARTFGAQYVVVRADEHPGDLSELPRVYANDEYWVYRIAM